MARPDPPRFRPDLETVLQPSPGRPDRCVVRDPVRNRVFEFTDKELFICRRLDGRTAPAAIADAFRAAFGAALSIGDIDAFVRQLGEQELLAPGTVRPPLPQGWEAMRRLPVPFDRIAAALSRLSPRFSPFFIPFAAVLLLGAAGIAWTRWDLLVAAVQELIDNILACTPLSAEAIARMAVFFVLFPALRELSKAAACRHYGAPVAEVRFRWFMRFIPRLAADLSGAAARERTVEKIRTVCAGLELNVYLGAAALWCWELTRSDNPLRSLALIVLFAGAVSFVLAANPLARGDGSLLLSALLEIPDLRERAIRRFRTRILRSPARESLSPREQRLFFPYGLCSDACEFALNAAALWLTAWLLTGWLGFTGLLLFAILLVLRFEDNIKEFFMGIPFLGRIDARIFRSRAARNWTIAVLVAAAAVILYFLPWQQDISGQFRVQPGAKREVRTEVSGFIEAILVGEGESVRAGQTVARISQRQTRTELEQTEASLRREEADLRLLQAQPRQEAVSKAEQEVRLRETVLGFASSKLRRYTELHAKKHVSDQEFENVRKEKEDAAEALELAKRNLDLVKSGAQPEEIEAQKAEIERLSVNAAHLRQNLALTEIRAPMEGRISTLYIREKTGQMAAVGDLVAIVENSGRTTIRIAVPEEAAGQVRIGARVRARTWAFPDRVFEASVTSIAPLIVDKTEDVLKQASAEQEHGTVRTLNTPEEKVVPVLAEAAGDETALKTDMTGYAKIRAERRTLGRIVLAPVVRFFKVRVWSWLP